MTGNSEHIKVTDNFTIPPDAELVKMPVEFKINVNLY